MFLLKCLLPRTLRGENYFPEQNAGDLPCLHAPHCRPLFLRNQSFVVTGKHPFLYPSQVRAGACKRKAPTFKSSVAWGPSCGDADLSPTLPALLLGWTQRSFSGEAKCMARLKEEGRGVKSLSLNPRPGPGDARARSSCVGRDVLHGVSPPAFRKRGEDPNAFPASAFSSAFSSK